MIYHFCTYIPFGRRVDIYLSALFSDEYSRSYIQKMMARGFIKVNGKTISKHMKLKPRDELYIDVQIIKWEIEAEDLGLDVIFEDENIILINKDPWVNAHPVPWEYGKSNTLVNAILFHCSEKLPTISGEERPGIVHRLDKDTSGVIMIAKNDKMMEYLQTLIREREVEKYYIAIVKGKPKDNEFRVESYIGRDPSNNLRMTTKNPLNPKLALSVMKVLWYIAWDDYSIIQVKLETGRTHQIRVHLSSIGFPIVGDSVYGNIEINKKAEEKYGVTRQLLHAHRLIFKLYGEKREFQADFKDDMKKVLWDRDI